MRIALLIAGLLLTGLAGCQWEKVKKQVSSPFKTSVPEQWEPPLDDQNTEEIIPEE